MLPRSAVALGMQTGILTLLTCRWSCSREHHLIVQFTLDGDDAVACQNGSSGVRPGGAGHDVVDPGGNGMFDSRRIVVCAALTALAVAVAPALPAQAQTKQPKITARPRTLMVNATTMLTGSGFLASTVIELGECGSTFWLAPRDPCIANEQAVTTDRHGRFRATFRAGLCPEGEPGKMPNERTCYIGELVTGEDAGSLVGSAKITVTYP